MGAVAELDAAGISGAGLRRAYAHSRVLNARHGRTYYLATRVLPAARRPAIHALYGFARWVDDVVDDRDPANSLDQRHAALDGIEEDLGLALAGGRARNRPVRALADTAARYRIAGEYFTAFMASMRSDLTVADYADYAALRGYMYGSAAVIGLQVLPVLGTVTPREEAAPHAAALGEAFQLTNFLRDVSEDLDRGRIYLPADILASHGVDRELLLHCRRRGRPDGRVSAALRDLVALNYGVYRQAEPGCAMLSPVARPCVETALRLYRGILDEISRADYDVWNRRHRVSTPRRMQVAIPALARTLTARREGH